MRSTIIRDISIHRNAYLLTVSACMITLLLGWDSGITGGILALKSFQEYFRLNDKSAAERADFSGNFASIPTLGEILGGIVSAFFFGKFGRRPCLVASAIIHVVGSLTLCVAGINSNQAAAIRVLYCGRFLCGFGGGIGHNVLSPYISESVPASIRGRCSGTILLSYSVGLMLSFWVNFGVSEHLGALGDLQWRVPFIVQIFPGVGYGIVMLFLHESPHWLIENGRFQAASKALAFTHRSSSDSDSEMVSNTIEHIRLNLAGRNRLSLWDQLKGMKESRAIALQCFTPSLAMLFAMTGGNSAVGSFTPQVFNGLGISQVSVQLFATGIYGVVKVVAAFISLAFVVERFGRKKSLIFGGLGQAIIMLWLAGYSALHPSGNIVPSSYVSIIAIYLFVICYSMGWGPLAYIIMVDVAPYHLRPVVITIAGAVYCLSEYAVRKLTPIMLNNITYGTYLIFGICSIIMVAWSYVFLPETTGYTQEEVKYLFERDVILRSLQDSPGGCIFIGNRRAPPIEELRIQVHETVSDNDSKSAVM